MDFFKIIFLAILANNVVLTQFIGVRHLLGQVSDTYSTLRTGIAIMFVLTIVNIISFCINHYILYPLQILFLQTFVFIIVILSFLSITAWIIRNNKGKIFQKKSGEIQLISTNSIILGICLLTFKNYTTINLIQTIIFTISSSAGYLMVMIIMAGIAEQIRLSVIPKSMKGFPISLITLGILALAFMGLAGIFR